MTSRDIEPVVDTAQAHLVMALSIALQPLQELYGNDRVAMNADEALAKF